jgi:hypothetical protein
VCSTAGTVVRAGRDSKEGRGEQQVFPLLPDVAGNSSQNGGEGMEGGGEEEAVLLLLTPGEEQARMGEEGKEPVTTDTGLTSIRAFSFLVLWYFFSGASFPFNSTSYHGRK